MRQHDDKGSDRSVYADVFEKTQPDGDHRPGSQLRVETSDEIPACSISFSHVHQMENRTNEQ